VHRSAVTGERALLEGLHQRFASVLERAARAPSNPLMQDAAIAAVLATLSLLGVVAELPVEVPESGLDTTQRELDPLGIGLVLMQTVPLVWRRRAPVLVLVATASGFFLSSMLGYFHSFASLGFLMALYSVAAHRDRRTSIRAGIASAVLILLVVLLGDEPMDLDDVLTGCLVAGAVWFIGDGIKFQRGQVLRLEDRASRLEREREEQSELAVAQERRVIARELHDVVAHNVSVMVAQAGAAQRIIDSEPHEARTALGAIEHAGRSALVEMRRLMGFLRTEIDRTVSHSPQPGLDNLEALVDRVRDAGISVTLRIEGARRPLPAGLDLSAYRLVQEGLTNVLKHAGPARADVTVRYGPSHLQLTVEDDGRGTVAQGVPSTPPGYGLLGMRERVALFGGELQVGASPGGGYRLTAILPLEGEPR
jgi:signal transduction histidine kinase